MNRALQWKLIAGFLLVFLAGGITGGFVGARHVRHKFFHSPHRAYLKDRMGERLRVQLKLTPEQIEKISPIIDRASTQLEEIRTETSQRVHRTMAEAHREMAGSLTEEQRAKLQQIQLRHQHRRAFRERRPRPPPPEDRQQ